jgi:cell division protein ZapA
MSQVNVTVNGRPYAVGCEDGQEQHVRDLASVLDGHVRSISGEMGQLGESRLFLMGALMVADELAEAKARLASLQAEVTRMQADRSRAESRAVQALEAAAKRIEKLASEEG